MLDLVPAEVLAIIVRKVENRADVKRLCEVSRGIYSVAAPVLYESLVFSASETGLDQLITTLEWIPHSLLSYTKHLALISPADGRRTACVHSWANYETGENPANKECDTVQNKNRLEWLLRLLFSRFRKQSLQSFRWELGCIPSFLLDGPDSPLQSQQQIETIALVSDPACPRLPRSEILDLAQLSDLRSLSWQGVGQYEEFESIRKAVKAHGPSLRSLNLDLVFWSEARNIYNRGFIEQHPESAGPPDDFFAAGVLGIYPGSERVVFPSLRELSLSEVSFRGRVEEMVRAFNVENLESLTLRNCSWTSSWFASIIAITTTLHLKRFELKFSPFLGELGDPLQWHFPRHLPLLLGHFSGLEDLYLMLYEPLGLKSLAPAILHHGQTLRRLIVHCMVQGAGVFFNYDRMDEASLPGLFQSLSLSCVGLCISAPNLRGVLGQCASRPRWRLLHLRNGGTFSSGLNVGAIAQQTHKCNLEIIRTFARWAFGPDGLPELEVLVYGEFSSKWNSDLNICLCRSDDGYHTLTREDEAAWDLFQGNMDMLTACPWGSEKASR